MDTVTDIQRIALGLPIPVATRTPIGPPTTRPVLMLAGIQSRTLKIRLWDKTTPTRRAKTFGVEGADIYSFIGENPPGDLSDWTYKGLAHKFEFTIPFNGEDIGKVARIRAVWKSTRGGAGRGAMRSGGRWRREGE